MPMDIVVNDNGQEINTNYDQLLTDLVAAGHKVKADPTGMNFAFDVNGEQKILPVSQVISQMGLQPVSMVPSTPNYDTASSGLRYACLLYTSDAADE